MKYKTINGWTKAKMIAAIQTKMMDHPSISGLGGCTYLAADGNKCAVGVFIPDGHVAQEATCYMSTLLLEHPTLEGYMPLQLEALCQLQSVHDSDAMFDSSDRRPKLIAWIEENVEDAA